MYMYKHVYCSGGFFFFKNIKDEKRGILQSLKLFTLDICDKNIFV